VTQLAVQRFHRLSHDRDWLPPAIKRSQKWTSATTVAAAGAGTAALGLTLVAPFAALLLWKGVALGGIAGFWAGRGAGQRRLRRDVLRMASGEIPLSDLEKHNDGELVVAKGVVKPLDPLLRGILNETEGVYRRAVFHSRGKWVHEAAVDFALLDAQGTELVVHAAGARWLAPERECFEYPVAQIRQRIDATSKLHEYFENTGERVSAFEHVLQVGEEVQVVGYKSRTADSTGTFADYRLPPQRISLQSGPDIPLLVLRCADAKGDGLGELVF
jgi:hypothetical protein